MSLSDELKRAAERDKLRLHTPGHKGKLCEYDLTELTDDSFPADCVTKAQARAAKAYGAKHARYLCGGSSQGVKAAVFFSGASAVVDVNSHRSVFDGFKLSGKRYVTAGQSRSIYPLSVGDIEGALDCDTKAIVVTSPTYYGYCADVAGLRDYCKKKGLLFIVDSAHGAHFGFSNRLPKSAAPHCDICNVSTHKTLSALTQTALLFDNLSDTESAALDDAADVMGTTSPSYLLYASIDHAVTTAADNRTREAYDTLYDSVDLLRRELPFLKNDDFSRLVLDCTALKVDPFTLNTALVRRGVFSEKVDEKRIVFILTAENTPNDVERLARAITDSVGEIK